MADSEAITNILKPCLNKLNRESTCPLLEYDCCLVFGGTDASIFHMVHRLPHIKAILLGNAMIVSHSLLIYMIMSTLWA